VNSEKELYFTVFTFPAFPHLSLRLSESLANLGFGQNVATGVCQQERNAREANTGDDSRQRWDGGTGNVFLVRHARNAGVHRVHRRRLYRVICRAAVLRSKCAFFSTQKCHWRTFLFVLGWNYCATITVYF